MHEVKSSHKQVQLQSSLVASSSWLDLPQAHFGKIPQSASLLKMDCPNRASVRPTQLLPWHCIPSSGPHPANIGPVICSSHPSPMSMPGSTTNSAGIPLPGLMGRNRDAAHVGSAKDLRNCGSTQLLTIVHCSTAPNGQTSECLCLQSVLCKRPVQVCPLPTRARTAPSPHPDQGLIKCCMMDRSSCSTFPKADPSQAKPGKGDAANKINSRTA